MTNKFTKNYNFFVVVYSISIVYQIIPIHPHLISVPMSVSEYDLSLRSIKF
ncbi:hypothetical protein Hanom_Chr02g00121691 [Helianthus anomalus]